MDSASADWFFCDTTGRAAFGPHVPRKGTDPVRRLWPCRITTTREEIYKSVGMPMEDGTGGREIQMDHMQASLRHVHLITAALIFSSVRFAVLD